MVKKFFYVLMAFLFIYAFTITTPVYAQEEEEDVVVEDVADISLEDLLNVEITTAGKTAEKIGEIPASVIIVTRDDIETYGYQDLSEILENIPGVYQTNDFFSRNFGVRGFWTVDPQRNVVILVNGVRQTANVLSAQWIQHLNIPVEAIDRIEMVRGPMSVIYGTGAFFGAINILTNVAGDEPVTMVSAAAGSEKTYKLFARASGNVEDFQYSFNASYFDTEGPNHDIEKIGGPDYAGATSEGLLENEEIFFNFSGSFKDFYLNTSYTESNKEIFVFLPPPPEDGGMLITNHVARVYFGYQKQFSDKIRFDGKLGYFLNQMFFDYSFLFPGFFGKQPNKSSGYEADLTLFFDPTPNLNITVGLNYYKVIYAENTTYAPAFNADFSNTLGKGESMVTQSVFAQLNLKLSEQFKIVVGARVEQLPEFEMSRVDNGGLPDELIRTAVYDQSDAEIIPRVALIYLPNEKHSIKLLYGKALNRPSFFQSIELLSNPSAVPLEPEGIQTFELNYIGSISPKFTVSMSIFQNMMDKLIFRTLIPVGTEIVSSFANVGEITTTGMELTLQTRPSEKFSFELSGVYQNTQDKREGIEGEVGYSPKLLGYLKASYAITPNISLAVTGSYVDKMEAYFDTTLNPPDGARLGEPVESYFLLGANLRVKNLFDTGMFLNIRGSNLLDQEIHYPATSNNFLYARYGTMGRGMSFLATLGYRFIPTPTPEP